MKAQSILETIGNTPHIKVQRLFGDKQNVWIKKWAIKPRWFNQRSYCFVNDWSRGKDGSLKPGSIIIEATSGNTGVGLAMVAAVKGYKLILVMPESMSVERRRLMLAYGATFALTPKEKGMNGAIAKAQALVAETPNSWMPKQFENPANIDVHVEHTAQEILADFPMVRCNCDRRRHRRPHYRLCASA